MLNLINCGDTITLEADPTTMQLILRSAIDDLLGRKGSPGHLRLYHELANQSSALGRLPLHDTVVEPEEMLRRLNAGREGHVEQIVREADDDLEDLLA
ncbi:hypothetical protein AEAC466_04340 [Asticcacaulis sp. AC466]|uniref:hypothetical protein n=1 Tax=Asticcacaulis sp. AC466 TaxID=1282362 RepID=UPI0003C3D24E|nr:hypothetical protein [Asticcacaulis sp. AC466]ESQ85400.1 hypothetical protein AEAC466_04340 [Asticcacaulis sp. AC466]